MAAQRAGAFPADRREMLGVIANQVAISLQRVARILRASARKIDIVARYGGEEFAPKGPQSSFQAGRNGLKWPSDISTHSGE